MNPSTEPSPSTSNDPGPLQALIVGVVALVAVVTAFSVAMAGAVA